MLLVLVLLGSEGVVENEVSNRDVRYMGGMCAFACYIETHAEAGSGC